MHKPCILSNIGSSSCFVCYLFDPCDEVLPILQICISSDKETLIILSGRHNYPSQSLCPDMKPSLNLIKHYQPLYTYKSHNSMVFNFPEVFLSLYFRTNYIVNSQNSTPDAHRFFKMLNLFNTKSLPPQQRGVTHLPEGLQRSYTGEGSCVRFIKIRHFRLSLLWL